MHVRTIMLTAGLTVASLCRAGAAGQAATPLDAVNELLAADRAFAAASSRTDVVTGLSATFADDVIMMAPREGFVEGKAKATMRGKGTAVLGPGSFFGEMSLLDQGPRSATVTAETDMRLLVLGSREFSALVNEVPVVAVRIMRGLAERLRAAEPRQPHH